jgi:uncharacterized membrane protein
MALGMATRQLLWVQQLIQDVMGHRFKGNLVCDNELAIKVSKDDSSNKRTRHTEREFFITKQALFEDKASITWTPTDKQLADILTKALSPEKHETFATQMMGTLPGRRGGC